MALIGSGSVGAIPRPGLTSQEGGPMGLKEYDTVINGQATVLQLSDEDAKLQGFTSKDVAKKAAGADAADAKAAAEDAAKADADAAAKAEAAAAEDAAKADADAAAKAEAAAANKAAKAPLNKAAQV